MYRYRELLTSFLASAMLTTTLFPGIGVLKLAGAVDPAAAQRALQMALANAPAGFKLTAAESVVPVAVPFQSAPSAPIRPEKLQALIEFVLKGERAVPISQGMAQSLGLAHPFMTKNARIETGTVRHGLAVGVSDTNRMVFYRKTPDMMLVYATDRQAQLLAAGKVVNGVFTAVPMSEAKAPFEEELRKWDSEPLVETPPVVAAQSNS